MLCALPSTLYPPPSTLYPLSSTLHPLPSTLYPLPSTLHPLPSTLYPPPSILYPLSSTLYPASIPPSLPPCLCVSLCFSPHSLLSLSPSLPPSLPPPQSVQTYRSHHHSCFIYLGSVIVDEFGSDPAYHSGLLGMLQVYAEACFPVLGAPNGLVENPDTIDDIFRLCAR